MSAGPQIALIHAVKVAIAPVEAAFARAWPQARLMNLLDDTLSQDRARDGALTPAMFERFETLATYARGTGADAILFTCSAFGPAIEAVAAKQTIPVLKPNEAMFAEALRHGNHHAKIGLLASFAPSLAPMEEEFYAMAQAAGTNLNLVSHGVPEAMAALNAGDAQQHDQLLAASAPRFADCATVMLAQFSTARARPAMEAALGASIRVLTSPDAAVAGLRAKLRV